MKSYVFSALTACIMSSTALLAQTTDGKIQPQISVSGEGKVKVAPDQVTIVIGIENTGSNPTEVKKKNDADTERVVQFLKKQNLPKGDVQTQRVSLNPNYDYEKKKHHIFIPAVGRL